jgi:hypothetical protein
MTGDGVRVGDSDREAAVTALADHYAAGRLTKEEFDQRADTAWAARTTTDLFGLFTDLPGPVTATAAPPPVAPVRPQHRPPLRPPLRPLGWRPGWLPPLLVVVAVLVVLTHVPLFLLLGLIWVLVARGGHRRRSSRGPSGRGWSSSRR